MMKPRVDHANEFIIDMISMFQRSHDARKAFEEACKRQKWSIEGTTEVLEGSRSVEFFAAEPE
eukprot:1488711-Amphidinium_carterae.1